MFDLRRAYIPKYRASFLRRTQNVGLVRRLHDLQRAVVKEHHHEDSEAQAAQWQAWSPSLAHTGTAHCDFQGRGNGQEHHIEENHRQ